MTLRTWLTCVLLLSACAEDARAPEAPLDMGDDAAHMPGDAGVLPDAGSTESPTAGDAATDAAPEALSDAQVALDAAVVDAATSEGCPPVHQRTLVDVPAGTLPDALTHWTCDKLYTLQGIVFVHAQSNAVVTAQATTTGRNVRSRCCSIIVLPAPARTSGSSS